MLFTDQTMADKDEFGVRHHLPEILRLRVANHHDIGIKFHQLTGIPRKQRMVFCG